MAISDPIRLFGGAWADRLLGKGATTGSPALAARTGSMAVPAEMPWAAVAGMTS